MQLRTLAVIACLLCTACLTHQKSGTETSDVTLDPQATAWCDENIQGLASVRPEQKMSVYYIVSIFLKRLTHWQSFKPFYDKLYSENKKFARQNPYFVDVKNGLFMAILQPNQKLTDLIPYRVLKGKTVEDILPDHPGDKRSYDKMPGEGARQTLIVETAALTAKPKGTFNTYYHEFGHLIHLSLMKEVEFDEIEKLFDSAKTKANFLDDYAALDSSEYFAVGLEAYISETKQGTEGKYRIHTKQDLSRIDPKLKDFIDGLIQSTRSL